MESKENEKFDAIVIGAGFGGIRALYELKRLGLTVKCFEAGSDVGGTWYWNRYPGARTDSDSWVYILNFSKELKDDWVWNERYPQQEEVQKYLCHVTDRFDLRRHIQFQTRVKSANYNESKNEWEIVTTHGQFETCTFLIAATGPLSIGRNPPFRGLDLFLGELYSTSTWPKSQIDFKGKRVAIIGTGATAVQVIPKIAPITESLTVFQRTPNYVLPARNYNISEEELCEIKRNYDEIWKQATNQYFGLAIPAPGITVKDIRDAEHHRRILDYGWEVGGFRFIFETLEDLLTDWQSNDFASEYLRNKIHAIVRNEETAHLLCPDYPFLSKRPPCGHSYYEAFNRANVKLIDISDDSIEFFEKGIHTKSGDFEFDMIILAVGFDAATGALDAMDIRGNLGKCLKETWSQKVNTFFGMMVPEYPNFFMITGPQVPFGNIPVVVDGQVQWIGEVISHMKGHNLGRVNVSETPAVNWSKQVDDVYNATVLAGNSVKARAWFVGANVPGKRQDVLYYFGGVPNYLAFLKEEVKSDFCNLKFDSGST